MSLREYTNLRSSLTSLTGSVDSPLPRGPQMTESTPEAIKEQDDFTAWLFNEPLDTHPSQDLSSKGIRYHQPAIREPETGVQTEQLTAAEEEAITTLQTPRFDEAMFRRFLQEARRERPATSSKEIADPYDHSDGGTMGRDDPPTENSAYEPGVR